jgi:hypothetical protein
MKPSKFTQALYQQILTEQLVEPEPTLTPAEVQSAVRVTTSSLIETHNQLTHLQKYLAISRASSSKTFSKSNMS